MPKQKTRRSAAKRFSLTGTGKIKRNKANHSHMLIRRSNSAKRKMRQSDLVLMLPTLPLLFIISAFAELKIWHLAVVLGLIGGLGGTVITIKSQALQVKVKPFVDSARITGGSQMKILFSHVLPNVAPIALLFMVFSVTGAIASESVLSFLGLLNIEMSWGLMIYLAQVEGYIFSGLKFWWLILPAGLSVTFLTGGFYLVGRGLDEVFNPRLRKR